MKTLNKTFGLSIIFSAFMLFGFTPNANANDSSDKNAALEEKAANPNDTTAENETENEDEFDFDFSDPFFFSDKVTIKVYGEADKLLYSGSFTKEEMHNDEELKGWLKKSEFLLSIDNQHYYFSNN